MFDLDLQCSNAWKKFQKLYPTNGGLMAIYHSRKSKITLNKSKLTVSNVTKNAFARCKLSFLEIAKNGNLTV